VEHKIEELIHEHERTREKLASIESEISSLASVLALLDASKT